MTKEKIENLNQNGKSKNEKFEIFKERAKKILTNSYICGVLVLASVILWLMPYFGNVIKSRVNGAGKVTFSSLGFVNTAWFISLGFVTSFAVFCNFHRLANKKKLKSVLLNVTIAWASLAIILCVLVIGEIRTPDNMTASEYHKTAEFVKAVFHWIGSLSFTAFGALSVFLIYLLSFLNERKSGNKKWVLIQLIVVCVLFGGAGLFFGLYGLDFLSECILYILVIGVASLSNFVLKERYEKLVIKKNENK
jgi:hypothetical protein